jgi:hypothetical protein
MVVGEEMGKAELSAAIRVHLLLVTYRKDP